MDWTANRSGGVDLKQTQNKINTTGNQFFGGLENYADGGPREESRLKTTSRADSAESTTVSRLITSGKGKALPCEKSTVTECAK